MNRVGLIRLAAGLVGVAVTGAAAGTAVQRRRISKRDPSGPATEGGAALGSLRAEPLTVIADDGVPLHVEIDEPEAPAGPVSLVFVHGYALNLDCWHFQRSALRGRNRTVFYDQRSHGRSGRSSAEHATIEQLGADLARVLQEATDGPVVLIGHSMGGMSVLALADQRPELFGTKVVGVGLLATAAGGLVPHKTVVPMLPARLGGALSTRLVAVMAHGHRAIDGVRRLGKDVAIVTTDLLAFGEPVPEAWLAFVDDMLAATPFDVLADFYGNFGALDLYSALDTLAEVPTVVVCGTKDRMTPIGLSRQLVARVPHAELVECEGAGHLVILEQHEQVTAAIDDLRRRAERAYA